MDHNNRLKESSLEKVIHKELMIVPSFSTQKEEVIAELASLLYKEGYVSNRQAFIDDVYLREQEGMTGIGHGVAIPHGKSTAVRNTTIAIAVMKEEILWETLDDSPVKVIIMFAVTEADSSGTHVLLLQEVAKLLAHNHFLKQLVDVQSVDELYNLIIQSKK